MRYLDLSKNRLTGALPVGALASLPLTGLYLVGNRLADPSADGADVQSYLPKCLVSVDRGPPPGAAVSAIAVIGGGPRSTETRHFGKYDWTSAPSALGSASLFPTR